MSKRSLVKLSVVSPGWLACLALLPACGDATEIYPGSWPREDAIIAGSPTGTDAYTAVGALWATGTYDDDTPFSRLVCTATLVAPAVVLTAAHCLEPAVLGAVSHVDYSVSFLADITPFVTATDTPPTDAIALSAVTLHPEFQIDEMMQGVYGLGQNHDVALGFLAARAPIEPAVVLEPDDRTSVLKGAEVTIVGYGAAAPGRCATAGTACGIRRAADATVAATGDDEMQVGGAGAEARKCHGDSGGPTFLVVADGGEPAERLVGITSHSYDAADCASGAVDTLADPYRMWIASTMIDACTAHERSDCENGGALAGPRHTAVSDLSAAGCGCRSTDGSAIVAVAVLMLLAGRRRP